MTLETQAIRNVVKNYGSRPTQMEHGGRNNRETLIKTATWTFDYNQVPFGSVAASELEQIIPANSTVVSARLRIITAFTSTSTTTDLAIGTSRASDGVTVSSNGFISVSDATQTTIAVAGDIIDGTGAVVGSTVGANDVQIRVVYTVDDMLTGRGEFILEYMTPAALPAS